MQPLLVPLSPGLSRPTRLPQALAFLAILATALTFFVGTTPLPPLPSFLPAVVTASAVLYLLTAFHLFRLYVITARPRLAALSATFALAGSLTLAYLLTFPGTLPFLATVPYLADTTNWLWLIWHLVFALGIVVSFLVSDQAPILDSAKKRAHRSSLLTASAFFFISPLLAFLLTILFLFASPYLPQLATGRDYTAIHTIFEAPLLVILLFGLGFAFFRARSGTLLDRWLVVSFLVTFCDVQLTLSALAPYNLGWYLARTLSLIGASLLLFVLLDDFTHLHDDLTFAHEALRRFAQTDTLTQIANRDSALERASSLLATSTPFCLAILDLDHFKRVNDTHGHLVGDEVLSAAASRIVRALKAKDLAGRWGGEEFVLIYVGLDLAQSQKVAERVLNTLRSSPIATRVGPLSLTASIGLACASPGEPLDHLLARADAALYEAKRLGRNRLVVAASGDLLLPSDPA